MNNQLQKLTQMALATAPGDGQNPTAIPYFDVLKWDNPTPLQQGILKPSFCVIIQGNKKVLMGPDVIHYGPGVYLASLINFPVAGQIVGATAKNPYLGLRIEFTNEELTSVILDANLDVDSRPGVKPGIFTARADENILETFVKLFKLLETPGKIPYLSQLLKKELLYHLLTGEAGHLFAQNLILSRNSFGLGKAIHWIKENFDKQLSVEELARKSNMSVSSLHHKFKAFASMGPLQYQKNLRLQEARRLLLNGEETDATTVAMRVGYESSSQFSREYRKLFGLPPMQDAKALKKLLDKGAMIPESVMAP